MNNDEFRTVRIGIVDLRVPTPLIPAMMEILLDCKRIQGYPDKSLKELSIEVLAYTDLPRHSDEH